MVPVAKKVTMVLNSLHSYQVPCIPRAWLLLLCPSALPVTDWQGDNRKLFQYIWFATQTFLLLQICSLRLFRTSWLQDTEWSCISTFSSDVPCHRNLPWCALVSCLVWFRVPIMKPLSPACLNEYSCHLLWVWKSKVWRACFQVLLNDPFQTFNLPTSSFLHVSATDSWLNSKSGKNFTTQPMPQFYKLQSSVILGEFKWILSISVEKKIKICHILKNNLWLKDNGYSEKIFWYETWLTCEENPDIEQFQLWIMQ